MNAPLTAQLIRSGAIAPEIVKQLQEEIRAADRKSKDWPGRADAIEAMNQFKAGFMSGNALLAKLGDSREADEEKQTRK